MAASNRDNRSRDKNISLDPVCCDHSGPAWAGGGKGRERGVVSPQPDYLHFKLGIFVTGICVVLTRALQSGTTCRCWLVSEDHITRLHCPARHWISGPASFIQYHHRYLLLVVLVIRIESAVYFLANFEKKIKSKRIKL